MAIQYRSDSVVVQKSTCCLSCDKNELIKYLSLNKSALANAYVAPEDIKETELKVPLEVSYCPHCHLAQLTDIVNRDALFRKYAYFSSDSPQLLSYFDSYAEGVCKRFPSHIKKRIIEIASNDGVLLKAFKKRGSSVLGIDPAENIAKVANAQGIETIPDFFGTKLVPSVLRNYGRAGIIVANNVLAHTDNPHDVVEAVKLLLEPDGVFVFEVQYLLDLIEKNAFDNTYHEHVFYFSLLSLIKLLRRHSMEIFDVEHVDGQGGSLRVYAANSPLAFDVQNSVGKFLHRERLGGLDRVDTYTDFASRIVALKNKLYTLLASIKKDGNKIAGYGAAAKGNTLLQYCGIGSDLVDFIADTAVSKQGMLTPGTHIPIVSPQYLKSNVPDYLLILAWNYAPSIVEREKWFTQQGGKFIIPIPNPHII